MVSLVLLMCLFGEFVGPGNVVVANLGRIVVVQLREQELFGTVVSPQLALRGLAAG